MNEAINFSAARLITKLAILWIALLVLPFTERALLGARTYYFLYIGLGLVFVMYGLTIRSVFLFLRHTRREPVYAWIAFSTVVSFYLQRSRSLRYRIRSSSPHARGIDQAAASN